MWDFTIITDSVICHNRPDIVLMRKPSNEIFMIDAGESRISQKTVEKLIKYVDLKIEVYGNPRKFLWFRLLLVNLALFLLICPAIWSHSIYHSV